MAVVKHKGAFTPYNANTGPEEIQDSPELRETWAAGFRQNNDVFNAYEWAINADEAARPKQPGFDLVKKLKDTKYWDEYRDNFIGVESDAEFNYISGKIQREEQDRNTLLASGWMGTIAGVSAGVVSPTMLLPFIGQERGAMAVVQGMKMGLIGGALAELPLVANQETYSAEDAVANVAVQTVIGGLLGGAVGSMSKAERAAYQMDSQIVVRKGQSAGAAAVEHVGPEMKSGANTLFKTVDVATLGIGQSPITYNFSSQLDQARWMTAQLGDGGLYTKQNAAGVPTSSLGTAENAISVWNGGYAAYVREMDDIYSKYVFDGNKPWLAPATRANLVGRFANGKMDRKTFNKEVFKAHYSGKHDDPAVMAAAAAVEKHVYKPVRDAMQEVKLLPEDLPDFEGKNYVNWVFDQDVISSDPRAFVDFLSSRYNKKMQERFNDMMEKYRGKVELEDQYAKDRELSAEAVEELKDELGIKLKETEAKDPASVLLEDRIELLKEQAAQLKEVPGIQARQQRAQLLKDARDMRKAAGEPFAKYKGERRAIKRRLSNLNQNREVVEQRYARKLEKIERAEELSEKALNRLISVGSRALQKLESWSDEAFEAGMEDLESTIRTLEAEYERAGTRLQKAIDADDPDSAKLLAMEENIGKREEKLISKQEQLSELDSMDRTAARAFLTDTIQEAVDRVRRINDKRVLRTKKLREQAMTLSPDAYAMKKAASAAQRAVDERALSDRAAKMGASLDGNGTGLTADFTQEASRLAELTKDQIMGTFMRLPIIEMLASERGAALPRLLGWIPTEDMSPFLKQDMEEISKLHVRSMAPDIEITRRFGSITADDAFLQLGEEFNARETAIAKQYEGKPEKIKKESQKLQKEYFQVKENLEIMMKRLRHQHGLPTNPDGIGFRMAKVVSNLNTLRFLGGTLIASITDLGATVSRHGMMKVMKDSWLPFVTDLEKVKMTNRELRIMGLTVDTITNMRAHALLDAFDDTGRGYKFEKVLEHASGKMGVIAGFSQWTDVMKLMAGMSTNARISDNIGRVLEGKALKPKELEYMAYVGIDEDAMRRIGAQLMNGKGGVKHNGVWLPNTEDWDDPIATQIYRNAVIKDVNGTIVTPGLERPNWMTASTPQRLLGQIKSFAFSSTYRTLAKGLQQRDAKVLQGWTMMMGLGYMSAYINAQFSEKGRERWASMSDAEKLDRAYQGSGLLGTLGLLQDLATRIPATAPYASFGGGRSTRRGGDDILETLGGPTFDAAGELLKVGTGIDQPTQSTIHSLRLLMPFQNLFYLRGLIDMAEESNPFNLPEKRQ